MHTRRSGLGKIYAIGGTDVGVYEGRRNINFFLPEELELIPDGYRIRLKLSI